MMVGLLCTGHPLEVTQIQSGYCLQREQILPYQIMMVGLLYTEHPIEVTQIQSGYCLQREQILTQQISMVGLLYTWHPIGVAQILPTVFVSGPVLWLSQHSKSSLYTINQMLRLLSTCGSTQTSIKTEPFSRQKYRNAIKN